MTTHITPTNKPWHDSCEVDQEEKIKPKRTRQKRILKTTHLHKKPRKKKQNKHQLLLVSKGLYLKTGFERNGDRWLVVFCHKNRAYRKVLGRVDQIPQAEAEAMAQATIQVIRSGDHHGPILPVIETSFERTGEKLMNAYSRHWKPSTFKINTYYFRKYLVPWFKNHDITAITRQDVLLWFDSMHDRPGVANPILPFLSVLMEQAEYYGLRQEGSNPCRKIRRYKSKAKEVFLKPDEVMRLGKVLRKYEKKTPLAVAIIRLLLLTGCRKSEIIKLQWSFYRQGHLYLPDSKTGPRTIFLSKPARDILDKLPKKNRWVFPSRVKRGKPICEIVVHWHKIRKDAGLSDVRLHDLRHSYASTAIRQKVDLQTVKQLLGHTTFEATLKYIHLCDDNIHEAVQTTGTSILPSQN